MPKKILYWIFVLFLVSDLVFSCVQYYHTPLDGDLPAELCSIGEFTELRKDPFGINAVIFNKHHANPNRYVGHHFFKAYFDLVPSFFRNFTNGIESLYLSSALFKILVHLSFVFLIPHLVLGRIRFKELSHILLMLVSSVLIQSTGSFYSYIGFVDKAITYTFYYAFPILLILGLIIGVKNYLLTQSKTQLVSIWILVLLLPYLGPLNAPVVLILAFSFVLMFRIIKKDQVFNQIVNSRLKYALVILLILCLYSLFLERYNSLNQGQFFSIEERYFKLLIGFRNIFTTKLALPVLFLSGVFLSILLKKFDQNKFKQHKSWVYLIWLFCLLYMLALPLGGYKVSRPNILRYDTMIPVFCSLTYILLLNLYHLWNQKKMISIIFGIGIVLIYASPDKFENTEFHCQKETLKILSISSEKEIVLSRDCTVLSWVYFSDPKASTDIIDFLNQHKILSKNKQFKYAE